MIKLYQYLNFLLVYQKFFVVGIKSAIFSIVITKYSIIINHATLNPRENNFNNIE